MESKVVYKVMLAVQSAVFIAFLMYYGTNSAVTRSPQMALPPPRCDCKVAGAGSEPGTAKTCQPPARTSLDDRLSSVLREPDKHPTRAPGERAPTGAPAVPATSEPSSAAIRGPISNCSRADVLARPGVVLLVTTNLAFLDMTLNMLLSIRQAGVCVNTTVIAEDQSAYRYLAERAGADPAVHVVGTDSGQMPTNIRRYTQTYFKLFSKRQPYMLSFLRRGLDVLFSDSDTFWFRDPFPFFRGGDDFDMSMIDSKSPYPERRGNANFCAGFMYLRPTAATLRFLETWIETMNNQSRSGKIRADQNVLNDLLRADQPVHINIRPLDTNIFPWGPKFYSLLAKKANYPTVVMHAASIRGHDAKMDKFKSSNMWLVNATTTELLAAQSGKA